MVAAIAGAPPWNGTWVAEILAISLKKYSAAICEPLPTPAEAKVMFLPFAFLRKSPRLAAGLPGPVTSASGDDATIAIGFRSLAANPLLGRNVSLIATAVVVTSSV